VREGDTWRHYDQHDGLVWDDCDLNAFAAAADGGVWVGTSGGLSHTYLRTMTAWKDPPVAIFTKLTLGNSNIDPARQPSVRYTANALATSFSALTFAREGEVMFRYRLAPLFAEWRETRERDLQFPGLPPNSYRFEVQARDGWGRWSAQPAVFLFSVKPPWWSSWWFVSLLAGAALGTLETEWGRALQRGTHLSIVIMDVDFFKRLNDAAGHQAGDECLSLIAAELGGQGRRASDLVARIGGEEFALILPETDQFQAAEMAETVRLRVAGLSIPHPDSPLGAFVTVSLGVASTIEGSFPCAATLVGAADRALYEAKRRGRNQTVSYGPQDMSPEVLASIDLSRMSAAQSIATAPRAGAPQPGR
jgi:diguanylate cyclase (GGDEF)-like protein